MRIVFCGQKRFGADTLRLLIERGDDVAAVVCPVAPPADAATVRNLLGYPAQASPAAPSKRDPVHELADERGMRVIPQAEFWAETMPANCDVIIAAHFHGYVSEASRAKARLGALAYHPSLLPRHRGRDSIEWAIRFGERITGGTVYWMNDVVDGGPVAAQEHCLIRRDDTALSLWVRELAPMGLRLFRRVLADLDAGRVVAVAQDESQATWEPGIRGVPPLPRGQGPSPHPWVKAHETAS